MSYYKLEGGINKVGCGEHPSTQDTERMIRTLKAVQTMTSTSPEK